LKAFSAEDVPEEYIQTLASLRSCQCVNLGIPTVTMAAKDFTLEEAIFAFGLESKNELVKIPKLGSPWHGASRKSLRRKAFQ
jgi:hypothetical protein